MMVNIGTRIELVNFAFSSSRNAASIECKVLQYTTLSIKRHHERNKIPGFHIVGHPCLCLSTLRGSETTLEPGLFDKIYR